MSIYREAAVAAELDCPRCKKRLAPTDVARCPGGCGAWVSAFAATEVLTEIDRRPDPITRWWKRREPCPICHDQMTLRGTKPGLLQGCEGHGYWLDADAIGETGLARGVDEEALQRMREDRDRVDADLERRAAAEAERDRLKHEKQDREAAVARLEVTAPASQQPTPWLDLALAINSVAAGLLTRRFEELEARNAALEARIEALELARGAAK